MHASDTLVSIVTPTLNQGRYIEDTIRSVRDQTYPRIEHIVIDGGSTDGTLDRLRKYEEGHGLRWQSEPDYGMYDAIGKGFRLSRGDVLAYLNSDDVYPSWAVEVAVRAFDADPDLDVVYGDGLAIDVDSGRQRLAFIPPFDLGSLAITGSLVQPAVFLRRRVFERYGGFDARLRFAGDLEYWLRLGGAARFSRVDEVLAVERVHGEALSSASAAEMTREVEAIRARYRPSETSAATWRWFVARVRAAVWRRRLWLSFLRSARGHPRPHGGWQRFLSEGQLKISPARVALAMVPRIGAPFAWGAVVSAREWFGSGRALESGAQEPEPSTIG